MSNNFKKPEKKQFSITLDKRTVERIHHIRKVSNIKGYDAYKSLNDKINKWIESEEKRLNINKSDYKKSSVCPKCASHLEIRTGSNGKFIGCSSYPECKYTSSI